MAALPKPSFEPKTHLWRPGAWAPMGGALPNLRNFWPKSAIFHPNQSQNPLKTAKRRETVATSHVRFDCPLTKSFLLLSDSTICPRNGPKMAKSGMTVLFLCQTSPKPSTGGILGYVAQIRIPRAPSPPATPDFLWFPILGIAQRDAKTPGPVVTLWSRRAARPAHGGGQRSTRVPGAKKLILSKLFQDHLRCSNKCFEPGLSPWWRVLAHGKSQNALKMARFGTKNGSKMRQKRVFPKVMLDHLGCSNKCF